MKHTSLYEKLNSLTLNSLYNLFKLYSLKDKNLKIVLCYHSIGKSNWRFSTDTEDFARQLDFINKNFKVKSLSQLLEDKDRGLSITFDDGYQDVFKNAYPLMEKYGFKGTVFVLGDTVKANRKELDNKLEFMDTQQIKKLIKSGWEIGSHSNTHSDFHSLNIDELKREVVESKTKLETKLGIKIQYFAYPRGKYNNRIIELIRKSGYKAAFTVDGGLIRQRNKYLITRMSIEGNLTIQQFEALLTSIGLRIEYLFMNLLKIKERIGSL